jgi:hypothetical protein
MGVDTKVNKKQNNKVNRRSRKKRRTEVSSSEEDSSSSNSDSNSNENADSENELNDGGDNNMTNLSLMKEDESNEDMEIDGLHLDNIDKIDNNTNDKTKNVEKTEKDVIETRLKLCQLDNKFLEKKSTNSNNTDIVDNLGISSDEWLGKMLEDYGEDIETLRTTAADFKGESVALLAELLRESRNVFQEV